jgi:hypothetical protein
VPNLELAHHPLRRGKFYEEYVSASELRRIGKKWNRRVAKVIAQILPVWNPRHLYLGRHRAVARSDADAAPGGCRYTLNRKCMMSPSCTT